MCFWGEVQFTAIAPVTKLKEAIEKEERREWGQGEAMSQQRAGEVGGEGGDGQGGEDWTGFEEVGVVAHLPQLHQRVQHRHDVPSAQHLLRPVTLIHFLIYMSAS